MPSAAARAVNRVATTVRAHTARSVAKKTGLPVGSVKRRISIIRRATKTLPGALIAITGRPLNLMRFGARQLKRGGVSAKPWGKRQKFAEGFIARMPNGVEIVVKRSRAGKAGKKIQSGRWAGKSPHIEAMWGPGIANEAAAAELRRQRQELIEKRMPIELSRELRFRVSRLLVR